jgi:hypothetical protein
MIAAVESDGPDPEGHSRLLAASPDLLAACRAARSAFGDLNGRVSREVWDSLYEVNRTLDTAIAKARGGAR